jgi:TRAP-type C4-dicarboxylate transport system permease small subunit
MDKLFIFVVAVCIVIVGEMAVADAIKNAGVTGISALLLYATLPGAFVTYLITNSD